MSHYRSLITKGNLLYCLIKDNGTKVTVAPAPFLGGGMEMSCIEISLGSFH